VAKVDEFLVVETEPEVCPELAGTVAPGADVNLLTAQAATDVEKASGTVVLVAFTATCPYGLGACWGGAREALAALDSVEQFSVVVSSRRRATEK
jgi:hypothetical protein